MAWNNGFVVDIHYYISGFLSKDNVAVPFFQQIQFFQQIFFLSFNPQFWSMRCCFKSADKPQTFQSSLLAGQDNGLQSINMLCQLRYKHPVFILTWRITLGPSAAWPVYRCQPSLCRFDISQRTILLKCVFWPVGLLVFRVLLMLLSFSWPTVTFFPYSHIWNKTKHVPWTTGSEYLRQWLRGNLFKDFHVSLQQGIV